MELSKVPSTVIDSKNKDEITSKQSSKQIKQSIKSDTTKNNVETNFLHKIESKVNTSLNKSSNATKSIEFVDKGDDKNITIGEKAANAVAKAGRLSKASFLAAAMGKAVSNEKEDIFADGIKAKHVVQGGIGDCYFLAGLASLAEKRPQDIKKMIKDNGDNTYTVTFPGVRNGTVTIDKPKSARGALWASVIENAYVKLDKLAGKGGLTGSGIIAVTGHAVDSDLLSLTRKSTTREKLKEATQNNRIVTAAVAGILGGKDEKTNVVSRHVYSVLSYDAKTDTVKVRNPWGSDDFKNIKNPDPDDDGTFTLTLDEFDSLFTQVAYEQSSNAKLSNIGGYVIS